MNDNISRSILINIQSASSMQDNDFDDTIQVSNLTSLTAISEEEVTRVILSGSDGSTILGTFSSPPILFQNRSLIHGSSLIILTCQHAIASESFPLLPQTLH